MHWCVSFPDEPVFVLRPSLIAICAGHHAAAKLLSVLLYRSSLHEQPTRKNAQTTGNQASTCVISRTQAQFVGDMCGEMSEKTLHDVALPALQLLGYVDLDTSTVVHRYRVQLEVIRTALAAYRRGPEYLASVLREHLQREKFRITISLEDLLTDQRIFHRALEHVLLVNRESSDVQRGPKPRPEARFNLFFGIPKKKREIQEIQERIVAPCAVLASAHEQQPIASPSHQKRAIDSTVASVEPLSSALPPPSIIQRTSRDQKGETLTRAVPQAESATRPGVRLTPEGQQVKTWYETIRQTNIRPTDATVRACNGLATMDGMTCANLQAVLDLLDHDGWIREHNIAIDLQDLERPTGRFNFERMLQVVQRNARHARQTLTAALAEPARSMPTLPDYTHMRAEDFYVRT